MTLPVRKSLHDAVLQASKSDTWEQATKEWNEVSLIFNGIGRSNCVCGNAIKYAYELFNGVTGQRLFPIGSDCVRHFHRLNLHKPYHTANQHNNPECNTVPSKCLKVMLLNIIHQETDHYDGNEKSRHHTNSKY